MSAAEPGSPQTIFDASPGAPASRKIVVGRQSRTSFTAQSAGP
jgi:hypothetical protein